MGSGGKISVSLASINNNQEKYPSIIQRNNRLLLLYIFQKETVFVGLQHCRVSHFSLSLFISPLILQKFVVILVGVWIDNQLCWSLTVGPSSSQSYPLTNFTPQKTCIYPYSHQVKRFSIDCKRDIKLNKLINI